MINDIYKQADIVNVVSQYLPLSQKGNAYIGLCPFHEDHKPSMTVNPERQTFKCFACGAGGNAFQFVMKYDKLDFPHAVQKVAGMIQYPLEIQPQKENPLKPLYQTLDQFFNYCHLELFTKDGREALNYLHSRHFSDEIIKTFKIGFAPAAGATASFFQARKTDPLLLMKTGLIYEEEGIHPFFHSRIVIPVHDARGNPVGITARLLPGQEGPKYVNSRQSQLYQKSHTVFNYHRALPEARKKERLILVEGAMDVLGLEKAGIHEGVACLGTALTSEQLTLLQRANVPIIVLYDEDEAGHKAAYSFGLRALEQKIPFSIARLKQGKDPDDCYDLAGKEGLQQALETTVSFLDFCFEYLKEKYNLKNYEDKRSYALELQSLIRQLPEYEQNTYFKRIEEETGFSFSVQTPSQKIHTPSNKTAARKKRTGSGRQLKRPSELPVENQFQPVETPPGIEGPETESPVPAPLKQEWDHSMKLVFSWLMVSKKAVEYIDRATRFR